MAIDWASLVASSSPKTAENPCFDGLFRQKVGTESGGVGTESHSQAIEKKHVFNSVPTVPTVPTDFEEHREKEEEKPTQSSFIKPAVGGRGEALAPKKNEAQNDEKPGCFSCDFIKRPGLSNGLCGGGRDDLPPAFTEGHPLRLLPGDGGASCPVWRLHWSF